MNKKVIKIILVFVLIETIFLIFVAYVLSSDNQPKETYIAAFVTNGGLWEDGTDRCKLIYYDIDTSVSAPMKVSRDGYKFLGWHTFEISGNWEEAKLYNNTDQITIEGRSGMYGEVIFSAKWEKSHEEI